IRSALERLESASGPSASRIPRAPRRSGPGALRAAAGGVRQCPCPALPNGVQEHNTVQELPSREGVYQWAAGPAPAGRDALRHAAVLAAGRPGDCRCRQWRCNVLYDKKLDFLYAHGPPHRAREPRIIRTGLPGFRLRFYPGVPEDARAELKAFARWLRREVDFRHPVLVTVVPQATVMGHDGPAGWAVFVIP